MREKIAGCTFCYDTAHAASFVGLSWHFTSGNICHDSAHLVLSVMTAHIWSYLSWQRTSGVICRDIARVLTCFPYIGLIKKTISSKMPNTSPYSVALAPFRSACKFQHKLLNTVLSFKKMGAAGVRGMSERGIVFLIMYRSFAEPELLL